MTAQPAAQPSATVLREAMGHFASGVTVAATLADGIAHALTATAVCSVSLEPALVLLCVGRTTRFAGPVLASGTWTLSMLAADQQPVARHFSSRGRDLLTQFDAVPHRPAPVSGAPVIEGCLAWLELRTAATHPGGDHIILVGEVVAGGRNSAAPGPLTYYRGAYRA